MKTAFMLGLMVSGFAYSVWAGTCETKLNLVRRPLIYLEYHSIYHNVEHNSTFETCRKNTQTVLIQNAGHMSLPGNTISISAESVYSEEDQYDALLSGASISINAVITKDMLVNKGELTCLATSYKNPGLVKATVQKAGTEGKTFIPVELNPKSKLGADEQCLLRGLNILTRDFSPATSEVISVSLTGLDIPGTKIPYKLSVSAKMHESAERMITSALERLKSE